MISFGTSSKSSSSQQRSFVDPAQQPFLNQLRGGALAQTINQFQPGGIESLFDVGSQLSQQGQQFLGGIQGTQQQLGQPGPGAGATAAGAGGLAQAGFGGFQSQGQQALAQSAFGQNPILGQQIGQLGQDINRQFGQMLPGIESQAIGAGQLGGGRQGVAQGLLGQSAIDAFSRGATDLRGQDISRRQEAAGALGGLELGQFQSQIGALQGLSQTGLGQQGISQAGLLGQGQLGLGGLGQLQGQFNLGLSPFQAQFAPLQNLAQIVGQPTVLGTTQQRGSGSGFDVGLFNFSAAGGSSGD